VWPKVRNSKKYSTNLGPYKEKKELLEQELRPQNLLPGALYSYYELDNWDTPRARGTSIEELPDSLRQTPTYTHIYRYIEVYM
jgi:hypothetical protein